ARRVDQLADRCVPRGSLWRGHLRLGGPVWRRTETGRPSHWRARTDPGGWACDSRFDGVACPTRAETGVRWTTLRGRGEWRDLAEAGCAWPPPWLPLSSSRCPGWPGAARAALLAAARVLS